MTRAVAEEVIAALRAMATAHPEETKPIYHVQTINGRIDRSYQLRGLASRALSLSEAIQTLSNQQALAPVYREMAIDRADYLRAIGIAGLIAANDPAGPKQAAEEFRALFRDAYVAPIIRSLSVYRNPDDNEAVRSIGHLATAYSDLDMPELSRGAVEALIAIHTKQTLPALFALLDSPDAVVVGRALNGICLFVRNSPVVNAARVPMISIIQTKEPAPYRTPETDAYCNISPTTNDNNPPECRNFWKKWWQEHAADVMK
ncbi:MAG: hypothetical protein JST11_28310 [Acidobacteria bacterium]|nr:hypothetical protein [Acidobacteriota bacterium]